MGLIKEPLEIDFFVEPNSLTSEEKVQISKYIREFKAKNDTKKIAVRGKLRKENAKRNSAI